MFYTNIENMGVVRGRGYVGTWTVLVDWNPGWTQNFGMGFWTDGEIIDDHFQSNSAHKSGRRSSSSTCYLDSVLQTCYGEEEYLW